MTTTVTVEAHCSEDKEVTVIVGKGTFVEEVTLQNGETLYDVVYDGRIITVYEKDK